ncbi:MAG: hypothetical protein ABFD52_12265 [Acidobacteriota bacterium]
MKNLLLVSALAMLAACMGVPKGGATSAPRTTPPAQAASAPTPAGDSFAGTIIGHRMGGSMARPYIKAEIRGEDGQVVWFNLRKTTTVTDPAGNTIGFMKRYKNGLRVEIKFVVKDGQNEAAAWHYLD